MSQCSTGARRPRRGDGRGAHGTLVRAASRLTQSWSDCLGLALLARSALSWLQASPTGGPVRSRERFPVARPGRLAEMKRLMLDAGHADGLCRIRNVATRVNSCPTGRTGACSAAIRPGAEGRCEQQPRGGHSRLPGCASRGLLPGQVAARCRRAGPFVLHRWLPPRSWI